MRVARVAEQQSAPVRGGVPDLSGNSNTGSTSVDRKLVRNAWVELEAEPGEARTQILVKAKRIARAAGGYLASEGTDGFVIRVEADHIDAVMGKLSALAEVIDQGFSVEEVTAQYVDLSLRIENSERLQKRLHILLEKATKVEELLAVEKELSRVTEELERLKGQMRVLTKQIRLATIDVRFKDSVSPGPLGWVFYGLYRGVKWLFVWD